MGHFGVRDRSARERLAIFGDILRQERIRRGLLLRSVARVIGVQPNAVGTWERGFTTPSDQNLRRWAAYFDIEIPSDVAGWKLDGCGTYGGYAQHRNRHEEPCAPCVDAYKTYGRRRNLIRAARR